MNNKMKLTLVVCLSLLSCLLYGIYKYVANGNYLFSSLVKIILFVGGPILFYSIVKDEKLKTLVTVKEKKGPLKLAILFGMLTLLLIIGGYIILRSQFDPESITSSLLSEGISEKTFPYVFIYIVLVNAFIEELFFRGFVFLSLYKMRYRLFAYIFSSLLFSIYHTVIMGSWFSPGIFFLLLTGLIVAGLILNELDRRCDNLYGGLCIHVGANLAINLIGVYMIYFA